MAIIRQARPAGNFYILDKRISEDSRLTWEARGMLIFLLGKPDHWQVSTTALANETKDSRKASGRDSIRAILGELMAAGYVRRELCRAQGGKVDGYDYFVSEDPISPETDLPATAQPGPANPTQVSIEEKQGSKSSESPISPQGGLALTEPPPHAYEPDDVATIFDYWKATMKSPRAQLDDKRRRLIRNALGKMGYSPRELCLAIKGCSRTPHNMGQNDRKQVYNGLHIILRNADQIDRFIGNAGLPPVSAGGSDADMAAKVAALLDGHAAPDDGDVIDMEPA